MAVAQAVKRGTKDIYPANMDDALNLMIQPFDVSRAVNEGMAYMSSVNYTLAALQQAQMWIQTFATEAWGLKVRVVTGGWATAQLCEGTDVPVGAVDVAIRSFNRPAPQLTPAALQAALWVQEDTAAVFVCGTQLCEAFTAGGNGIALGGSSVDDPTMWLLNPNTFYGIEVTDVTGIANVVNITATFYLLNAP